MYLATGYYEYRCQQREGSRNILTTTPMWSKGEPPTTLAVEQTIPMMLPILEHGRSNRTRSPVSRPVRIQYENRREA